MFIQLKTTQSNIRLQNYSLTTPVYINKCYLSAYTQYPKLLSLDEKYCSHSIPIPKQEDYITCNTFYTDDNDYETLSYPY